MKNIIIKIILITVISIVCIYPFNTNALDNYMTNTTSENSLYSAYNYVIDNYDVELIVNENNTFDLTEKITVYYNVPKHGILRNIPLANTIKRLDGTTTRNRALISNLSVNDEYVSSRNNGNYVIKIGSNNNTFTGKKIMLLSIHIILVKILWMVLMNYTII